MNFKPWQHELEVAFSAVRDGALMARDIRQRIGSEALVKSDRSPVTVADFAVQAIVARRLADAFPEDSLVAEEDSAALRSLQQRPTLDSVIGAVQRNVPGLNGDQVLQAIDLGAGAPGERFWTLDPIDGTKGFVRGGQYVVALALIVRGEVQIGLLGCPGLSLGLPDQGALVFAVRGRGAFRAPLTGDGLAALHVSSCGDPRLARVLRSVEDAHIDVARFNKFLHTLAAKAPPTLMDSQAKHAVIAAGQGDLFLRLTARADYRDRIWDQAAGAIIVVEAGGRVTDVRGIELDFSAGRTLARNHGVAASNGHLHAAALRTLRLLEGRERDSAPGGH